jgi:K+-transporting ATPase A subunit
LLCSAKRASERQIIPKGAKMIAEIATTILVPLCVVTIVFLSMAVLANLKQRRNRRTIERGIKDFVRQVRS